MLNLVGQFILIVIGFTLLIKGADLFVEGASALAQRLGIPQIVIGLTIVAMGTSLPEASVSILSAMKGSADIAIGNVVGSNILNILIILGLTSLIKALPVKSSTKKYEMPFVVVVSLVLFVLGWFDGSISRIDGIVLWALFILYLTYLFWQTKVSDAEEDEAEEPLDVWKIPVFIVLGAAMIVLGADLSVDGASALAALAGVSERVIGLTIVALGTSLPELVTSLTAARRGKTDIAIGNIVGSNIFNILFVIGTSSLIIPVPYQSAFLIDSVFMIASALVLWVLVLPKNKITRPGGVIMLLMYAGYFVYLMQ